MTLHDGTRFSPQFIESKLKFSPYIKESVVFGGDLAFCDGALINIDMENTGKWAENHQLAYTTYTDLAQKEQVYGLVRKQVETANADLPTAALSSAFAAAQRIDADDEENDPHPQSAPHFVAQRYYDLIAALYGPAAHVDVQTDITYQDGRTATLNTRLKIEQV
ncbi:MAG: hypothetical protein R2911_09285 [Caldilineaceae bacterium]